MDRPYKLQAYSFKRLRFVKRGPGYPVHSRLPRQVFPRVHTPTSPFLEQPV